MGLRPWIKPESSHKVHVRYIMIIAKVAILLCLASPIILAASLEELKGTEKQQEVVQLIRNKRQYYGECWNICFVNNKHCASTSSTISCTSYRTGCGKILQRMYNRYTVDSRGYDRKKFDGCSIHGETLHGLHSAGWSVTCKVGSEVIRWIQTNWT